MKISIIGSGHIGGGLARAWAHKGHHIVFGARNPHDAELQALCNELGAGARATPVSDAAQEADVVVLAMPYGALDDVLAAVGSLAGKTVIDCTNAVAPGWTLKLGHTTSSAEELQKRIPAAHVVKSFNAQGAENLANPVYRGVPASNFYCGDDATAKAHVQQLITEVGFEAIDAGALKSARLLEPLMLLWISCAQTIGTRDIAFKLLQR
jgi:NADPH-dependent F420 reductase